MLTYWIRTQPRYNWDWTCHLCKRHFSSNIPYRVRLVDEGHNHKWCEDCYQKLMKRLKIKGR